jgi:hypothetical protein
MRWAGHITYVSDKKQKIFVIKSLGRQKDNIKMDLNETRNEDEDWVQWGQGWVQSWATANMLMKLQVPYKVGNFLTG